jgi:hypothetical protein
MSAQVTTSALRNALATLACAGAIALAGPAMAASLAMKADLSAANEVPVNTSKGTGTVSVAFDEASRKLTWKGSYANLSGPPTAAHFHIAEKGKNGGVAVLIFSGANAKTPFEGEATLTTAQASDLMAGKFYVNVHTEAHKDGEIRGQVAK